MKVLFVAPEVAPFSKTGGLADVAGALPAALASLGEQVRVVTPRYLGMEAGERLPSEVSLRFPDGTFGGPVYWASPTRPKGSGSHEVWFLDQPELFSRPGYYGDANGDYADNPLRFAYLCMGALEGARALGFTPDIVHLNDWQAALAALYRPTVFPRARTVFTVHNLAYHGAYPKAWMERLGISWDHFTPERLEFHDQMSLIKAGLVDSDAITTVSPTYAKEVQTAELGCGLEGLLAHRSGALHGILNGIDVSVWNPATDPLIPQHFSSKDLSGKEACKRALMEHLALAGSPERASAPLFAFVGRLVEQKGVQLLLEVLPQLLQTGATFAILGQGDAHSEQALRDLKARYPEALGFFLGFDEPLAHLFYAGADFLLMPSRFEPCGLAQMYALRYGTLPIVHATGGLKDTVTDLSEQNGVGLAFAEHQAAALWSAIQRALWLYRNRQQLSPIQRRGMERDFSWTRAARQYQALYRSLRPWVRG